MRAIALDIDSPGGSVFGVQELASEIMQARVSKPIIGFADSTCASAAYWIGACCSELYSTPGGECGSIGVWQQHVDISKSLEEEGINVTLISAGRFKTEGNQFGPLLPEGKNFMQERTDQYYRAFTTAVARGRGVPVDTVRNGMGQGRMLGAQDALREKMIDGVATISEVIGGMQRNIKAGSRGASAVPGRSAAALAHSARIREIEIMEAGGAPPARAPSPRLARMLSEIAAMERGAR